MSKKSLIALILSAVLSLGAFAGCRGKDKEDKDENPVTVPENAVREVGDCIALKAVNSAHEKAVNGSGMDGSDGRIHLHTAVADDMVKDSANEFIFDAGHIERLGELHIWNYNAPDETNNGLKEVVVSVSEDNLAYTDFGRFTLAQASGETGIYATNLADGKYIDFGGITGRFIKITATDNYGGDSNGLSEVRLFRYKQPIYAGAAISASPIERYVNNRWAPTAESYNLTNGAALSDTLSATATCDNNPAHMVTDKATAFDFQMDLKGEYPLSKLVLWNYNAPEHLEYGLKDIRIRVSDDSNSWKTIGTYTLPQGTGEAGMVPSLTIDMDNEHAHYVQIEIRSNYGGNRVGLGGALAVMGTGWYCDAAADYTAMFSRYSGWTGGDGVFSVNLDGKDYDSSRDASKQKTFFTFGDTLISEIDPVTRLRSEVYCPNNTSSILTGAQPDVKKMTYYYPKNEAGCANILPNPPEPTTAFPSQNKYYWLGDMFVANNKLYIYCWTMDHVDPAISGVAFAHVGVNLAVYDIVNGEPDFNSLRLVNDKQNRLSNISDSKNQWFLGTSVFENTENAGVLNPDGYIYVYGYNDVNNRRKLIVTRFKEADAENFAAYEYLDKNGNWLNTPPAEFKPLAEDSATECSVSQVRSGPYKGKFLFMNSHLTATPTIKLSISDSPYGVFTDKFTVFSHDTCASTIGVGNNTYNAKAHPSLSGEDELIFCYCINNGGQDTFTYADIYRPRFMRLALVAE